MGYLCPVCGVEQADAVHLANHLAVTASLGRRDHEAWLEEHAPDWAECTPAELGEAVGIHAQDVETPGFDDDHDHRHQARPPGLEAELAAQTRRPGRGTMTAETETVLKEARELTRQMHEPDAETGADGPNGDAPTDESTGDDRDAGAGSAEAVDGLIDGDRNENENA